MLRISGNEQDNQVFGGSASWKTSGRGRKICRSVIGGEIRGGAETNRGMPQRKITRPKGNGR